MSASQGHKVGTTTIGAAGGAGLAGAVAVVLVWLLSTVGVDVPAEVQNSLVVIIAAVGAIVGGKYTPTNQTPTVIEIPEVAGPGVASLSIPDGDGEHRADPFTQLDVESATSRGEVS